MEPQPTPNSKPPGIVLLVNGRPLPRYFTLISAPALSWNDERYSLSETAQEFCQRMSACSGARAVYKGDALLPVVCEVQDAFSQNQSFLLRKIAPWLKVERMTGIDAFSMLGRWLYGLDAIKQACSEPEVAIWDPNVNRQLGFLQQARNFFIAMEKMDADPDLRAVVVDGKVEYRKS